MIFLEYVGEGPIDTTLMLVGKVCTRHCSVQYITLKSFCVNAYTLVCLAEERYFLCEIC